MQKKGEDLSSVLYIEDDSINWEIVSLFLKGLYRVDTASDSSEALAKIKMDKYDIILLDISLKKGTDGLELAKESLHQVCAIDPKLYVVFRRILSVVRLSNADYDAYWETSRKITDVLREAYRRGEGKNPKVY